MMMASSSANVEAPPTAGVQLMEGPFAVEVPAGVHPGALSSRAGVGDTNVASAGGTNGTAIALCELLAVKLGIGGGPCWPPAIHALNPEIKVGTRAVIVAPEIRPREWPVQLAFKVSYTYSSIFLHYIVCISINDYKW